MLCPIFKIEEVQVIEILDIKAITVWKNRPLLQGEW